MHNKVLSSLVLFLVSTLALANDTLNVTITLNNQANTEITTDSPLVPEDAHTIAPQGRAIFDVVIPAKTGIQTIRYANDGYGCDFYFSVVQRGGNIPGDPVRFDTSITGMPISLGSNCNIVNSTTGVNHLSVAFSKNNPHLIP